MSEPFAAGRKVCFLNPPSVFQDGVMDSIIGAEYEVYLLYDHQHLLRILARYNTAIAFINLDSNQLDDDGWEDYIRTIMNSPKTKGVSVGILTYNENHVLAEKYLMELGIPCGYVKLSLGVRETTDVLLKTLEANEAKGRRMNVRARCGDAAAASFNLKLRGNLHTSKIRDISSAGMACVFDEPVRIKLRDVIPDIQLRLKTALCMVSGLVAAIRRNGRNEYVILFGGKVPQGTTAKIRGFVHATLQEEMAREIGIS